MRLILGAHLPVPFFVGLELHLYDDPPQRLRPGGFAGSVGICPAQAGYQTRDSPGRHHTARLRLTDRA